jgi:hypothetical protein
MHFTIKIAVILISLCLSLTSREIVAKESFRCVKPCNPSNNLEITKQAPAQKADTKKAPPSTKSLSKDNDELSEENLKKKALKKMVRQKMIKRTMRKNPSNLRLAI